VIPRKRNDHALKADSPPLCSGLVLSSNNHTQTEFESVNEKEDIMIREDVPASQNRLALKIANRYDVASLNCGKIAMLLSPTLSSSQLNLVRSDPR
jgi:hypothetical protein